MNCQLFWHQTILMNISENRQKHKILTTHWQLYVHKTYIKPSVEVSRQKMKKAMLQHHDQVIKHQRQDKHAQNALRFFYLFDMYQYPSTSKLWTCFILCRYLDGCLPLLTAEELANTKQIVDQFMQGDGPLLQKKLQHRADTKKNWVRY